MVKSLRAVQWDMDSYSNLNRWEVSGAKTHLVNGVLSPLGCVGVCHWVSGDRLVAWEGALLLTSSATLSFRVSSRRRFDPRHTRPAPSSER